MVEGEGNGAEGGGGEKKAMKFSFSMTKPSGLRPPGRRPPLPRKGKVNEDAVVEYVRSVDVDAGIVVVNPRAGSGVKVVPKLEDSWRPEKRMKNIMMEGDAMKSTEETFEMETMDTGPKPNVQYGLTLMERVEVEAEAPRRMSLRELEDQKLREDLTNLPKEATLDEYEELPVEEFGEALLRGMGWEKGKPIGRNAKTVVAPVEYTRRQGALGLGATPPPPKETNKKSRLKALRSGEGGSRSNSAPPDGIKKICDSVYLFSEPAGPPEMEIVFLHGLQISDPKEAYWKTWIGGERDEEVVWPMAWLGKEFPRARILSLCYDSTALRTNTTGRMDGYTLGETLVQEMVDIAKVGQHKDCPILFVCHSLGGLVVKEIVIQAQARRFGNDGPKYVNFLQNIRGFHFYATPHDGSKLADLAARLPNMGKMVEKLRVINDGIGRLNGQFERIERKQFADKWEFAVVAEQHKTTSHGFSAKVVDEASARHGYKRFRHVPADHFGVCKPKDKVSNSYLYLTQFISEVVMVEQKFKFDQG